MQVRLLSCICAQLINKNGHQSHTAPVYISVNDIPIRASAEDAEFFMDGIDKLIDKTSPGGEWNKYFPNDLKQVQNRYCKLFFVA